MGLSHLHASKQASWASSDKKMDTVYLAGRVALESAETVEQGIGWSVRERGAAVGLGSEVEVGTLQVKTR
jgi:hypothetical protein